MKTTKVLKPEFCRRKNQAAMNPIAKLLSALSHFIRKTILFVVFFACVIIVRASDEETKIDLSSNDTKVSSMTLNDSSYDSDSMDLYNIEETQSAFQLRSKENPVGLYGMMYSEPERIRGLQEEDEIKVGIGINIQF